MEVLEALNHVSPNPSVILGILAPKARHSCCYQQVVESALYLCSGPVLFLRLLLRECVRAYACMIAYACTTFCRPVDVHITRQSVCVFVTTVLISM